MTSSARAGPPFLEHVGGETIDESRAAGLWIAGRGGEQAQPTTVPGIQAACGDFRPWVITNGLVGAGDGFCEAPPFVPGPGEVG